MNLIFSTGIGRLHFIELAIWTSKRIQSITLITGWIPSNLSLAILSITGAILGEQNLRSRLINRNDKLRTLDVKLHSCSLSEIVGGIANSSRWSHFRVSRHLMKWAWMLHGLTSRLYLNSEEDYTVFHVRSGAGQGGAIARARRMGMLIVVDQSIAHPKIIQSVLKNEKVDLSDTTISATDPFWEIVLKDCSLADVLLVNSAFVRDTFINEGYPASKIRIVYLGVDKSFMKLKRTYTISSQPRLLFTGRFCARKGARYIIKALEILSDRGLNPDFLIAGSYDQSFYLAQQSPVFSQFSFLGYLPQHELKELLASSDLYVFPTLAEGCAKSAMEAMASGLPVITTPNCGLPGVSSTDYYEVPIQDALALADSIQYLLSNDRLRAKIGKNGAELVASNYTWDQTANALADVYNEFKKT